MQELPERILPSVRLWRDHQTFAAGGFARSGRGADLFDRQGNGSEQLCPGTVPPVRSSAPKGTVHVAKGASLCHKKFTKINKKNCEKC